jgi:hypothetical protein
MSHRTPEAEPVATPAEREAVRTLVDKYARMITLRRELGRGQPSASDRARLKALAADFPGSLRELETLTSDELAARHALASSGATPRWLVWTAAYHEAMRAELAARKRVAKSAAPHGRLNTRVFQALSERFGVASHIIWDTLFPRRGTAPRPYRD